MSAESSSEKLKAAATGRQVATKDPASFPAMLQAYKAQIATALPKHMTGDRLARIALTCFRQNPKLGQCDPKSVFASVIVAAQLGLEPGVLGQGFLVPYKTRNGMMCQFIPGWQGLVDLVNRSGRASVHTGAVYKGDEFEYEYGSNPSIHHKPSPDSDPDGDPANLLYVYAVGRIRGSEFPVIEVWSNLKVRRHRDRYNKVGDLHYSYENFEMYARKVALLQVIKYLPKSIENLANAIDANYSAEQGAVVSVQDAIDGTFLPAPAADADVDSETKATPEDRDAKLAQLYETSSALIRAAADSEALAAVWTEIREHYKSADLLIPISVEAARNDRAESLKQADAKRKGG